MHLLDLYLTIGNISMILLMVSWQRFITVNVTITEWNRLAVIESNFFLSNSLHQISSVQNHFQGVTSLWLQSNQTVFWPTFVSVSYGVQVESFLLLWSLISFSMQSGQLGFSPQLIWINVFPSITSNCFFTKNKSNHWLALNWFISLLQSNWIIFRQQLNQIVVSL